MNMEKKSLDSKMIEIMSDPIADYTFASGYLLVVV